MNFGIKIKPAPGREEKPKNGYETMKNLSKRITPPKLVEDERKTDPGLDSDAKFVEKLSGKPFRQGLSIAYYAPKFTMAVLIGGGYSEDDKTIYLPQNNRADARLHELTHAQCGIKQKSGKGAFLTQSYDEGMATFAECRRMESYDPLRLRVATAGFSALCSAIAAPIADYIFRLLKSDWSTVPKNLVDTLLVNADIAINTFMLIMTVVFAGISGWAVKDRLSRILFTNSLRKLSNEVGDPCLAFQIALEKQPKTWNELLRPLKFYKDEIAAAKANEENAPAAARES